MGPSNFSRSSIHVWRKNTSMVYSWMEVRAWVTNLFTTTMTTPTAGAASTISCHYYLLPPERMADGFVSHGFEGTCWIEYWQCDELSSFSHSLFLSGGFCY